MKEEPVFNRQYIEELLDIGISLSSERDLNNLLDTILTEARRFTNSDAGTIYLVQNDHLVFKFSQVQTLFDRWGEEETRKKFKTFQMPITKKSMAGYAAITGEILNIPNVHTIPPESEYQYNSSFDDKNEYVTKAMLTIPIKNRENKPVGILQLINPMDNENNIKSYSRDLEKLCSSLASQAGVAIQNAHLNTELHEAHLDTILRLGVAAEYRDKETANHIRRMARYTRIIAQKLNWSQEDCDELLYAAPMHDVGKLGIPDNILMKPGKLDPDERSLMEKHTIIGASILHSSSAKIMILSKTVALTHHEKWDGTGYPQGLKGEEIPLTGRITAIADVFDALSSRRCYKEPMPEEKVIRILTEEKGKHFDPKLIDLFLSEMDAIREIQNKYSDTDKDFDKFTDIDNLNPADLLKKDTYQSLRLSL